jgi:hypothetical protein
MSTIITLTPVVQCSWCDAEATYNLHTDNDHACFEHFKMWFAPGWTEALPV